MMGLIVSSLRAGYGGAPVLQNVSFQLENGRIMAEEARRYVEKMSE